ncbi:hypothetical protein KY361_06145 [Candidatus Woesearchaeota archaeon]|nr:hypothetical protein [Candidatus Woesearchaeota archaeon]
MKKKVLILECPVTTGGTGHEVAALSIKEALKAVDKNINALCACPVKKTRTAKRISSAYSKLINYAPNVFGFLHESKMVADMANYLRNRFGDYKQYRRLISSFKPDVVACTHAYPCWAVSSIKEKEQLQVPLIGVVTDFHMHHYWPLNNVDKYVVATKEAKNELMQRGINKDKVKDLGIPIHPKFSGKNSKLKIKKRLGLGNKPTILVMGGGLGIGSMERAVKLLDSMDDIQLIVVCGKNNKLKDKLLKSKFNNKLIVKGYVTNMDELMDVSDIAVTKAGGLTVSECLAKNLPMVVVNPIPGQEQRNTDYLVKYNAAVKPKSEKYLIPAVEKLLNKKNEPGKIAKPNSAIDIAKLIVNIPKNSKS